MPSGVSRIAVGIEYDGSHYHGWQRQPNHDTIANRIEAALSSVANHPVFTVCAGRTDSGVHAVQQIAHFDTHAIRQEKSWIQGANRLLPRDISIRWAAAMPAQFHARFSATSRSYVYIIDNSQSRPALLNNRVTWEYRVLNAEAMHQAAQCLVGTHDFSAFRATGCQAHSPVRSVEYCKASKSNQYIIIQIKANAFLYRMVRNIVGSLLPVGMGYQSIENFARIFESKLRSEAVNTAPAYGLYLSAVSYPEGFNIPKAVYPLLNDWYREVSLKNKKVVE